MLYILYIHPLSKVKIYNKTHVQIKKLFSIWYGCYLNHKSRDFWNYLIFSGVKNKPPKIEVLTWGFGQNGHIVLKHCFLYFCKTWIKKKWLRIKKDIEALYQNWKIVMSPKVEILKCVGSKLLYSVKGRGSYFLQLVFEICLLTWNRNCLHILKKQKPNNI